MRSVSNIKWKKIFRETIFNPIPSNIYIKLLPLYFILLNKHRRKCECEFKREKNGFFSVRDKKQELFFIDHRRLERYYYEDGINRIKRIMFSKYCKYECKVTSNDLVVEIGANIGEFTLAATEIAKQVYSFEPDPKCIECLKLNTKNIKNVEIVEFGASDENGTKVFYLSSEDADSSFITPRSYSEKISINAIRLDTWMQKNNIDNIDFLKLEAEGAELEVLLGLGERITSVNKISVDGGAERLGKTTYQEVNQFLIEKGFITRIDKTHVFAWKI